MPDLGMTVRVTRDALGLTDLYINDHVNYYCAGDGFLSGQTVWNRQEVTSPWVDGAMTTFRTRQMVTEPMTVEVFGEDQVDLKSNIDTLIQAFTQDSYVLNIILGGRNQHWKYTCEAADYQVNWNGPRFIAKQVQVVLSIPRQPIPLVGIA